MGTQLAGSPADDLNLDIFRLEATLRPARDLTVDQAWALATMYVANGTLPGVTLPKKPTRKAIINASQVNGVSFAMVNQWEMKGGRFTGKIAKENVQPIGTSGPLDLRFLVFIHRLAGRLRSKFGVHRIQHLGFITTNNDSHDDGRAIDFVGVSGQLDGYAFNINALGHWNLQPVPMTAAFGPHKAGDRADNWPAGFTGTLYRLDPAKNKYLDPEILRTNLGSTSPEFELKTAFELFQDVYDFAAREVHDAGMDASRPTTIGKDSAAIIHPDYADPAQRGDHFQHMHIEIGTRHEPRVAVR